MRYRWLGNTGLKVSEVGFGAWAIGGTWWGPQDDADSRLALHKSLDMGCNFIDTAWVYGMGHSERLIASVLKERHERPVIATKVPPKNWNWDNATGTPLSEAFTPQWIVEKAEESLKNLQVDCLDVLQLHTWREGWGTQASEVLQTIARLKKEGKIRAFGISLRDKGAAEANDLVRWRQVDTLQIFFNLFYQEPLWEVFPLAQKYQVGIIARVPLAFGALSGRFHGKTQFTGDDHRKNLYVKQGLQTTLRKVEKLKFLPPNGMSLAEAALKWTLSFPEVSTTIPGIRNLRQASLNCAAGEGRGLEKPSLAKARKLYLKNFGLPLQRAASSQDIPAVFMSGVKVPSVRPKASPRKPKPASKPRAKKGKASRRKEKMIKPWKKINQRVDYNCGFFNIQVHQSRSPKTGKKHPFYVLATRDWVNIVALTKEKKVLMVSQYRHGSEEVSLEIPGGAVDKGEKPLLAAKRELLEETGYRARRWVHLGAVQPNPAILNNVCHSYLALDCEPVAELDLDEAEELEVSLHSWKGVQTLLRRGRIPHALVLVAFYFFEKFLKDNPGKI